tara:strand:+ start:104 stop:517 length:414 start_codon:yes stop_codon:yes gene_type:complete
MEREILFTIDTYNGVIDIYGPTNEKIASSKVIKIETVLENAVLTERRERLKCAKNDFQIKEIIQDTNWKIRVLNEQRKNKEKMEKDAELLVAFAKKAIYEVKAAKRRESRRNKSILLDNTNEEKPLRRSSRIASTKE